VNEAQHKALTERMDRIAALLERILGHAEYLAQQAVPPDDEVQFPSAFSETKVVPNLLKPRRKAKAD
jgi:hypothetical protein